MLGDKARYIGIGHGKDKEDAAGDLRGKNVALLDFSFDVEATSRQVAVASQYVVLDHHASAQENLKALPDANKMFEIKMSGATLAWNFFHPGTEIPLLFRYVEDKDIWRWALHSSDAFGAAFELTVDLPGIGEVTCKDFVPLDRLFKGGDEALQRLLVTGNTILRYQNSVVAKHTRKYTRRRLKQLPEFVCAVVNATTLVSEIGDALAKEPGVNFAFIFTQESESADCQWRYRISLRSCFPQEGQADVSAIAKLFGGGGHRTAAGCGWIGSIDDIFLSMRHGAAAADPLPEVDCAQT